LSENPELEAVREIEDYCSASIVRHSKKPTLRGVAKSIFNPSPYVLSRFHSANLLAKIMSILSSKFDIVQIEGIHAAFYGLEIKKLVQIPVVLRMTNLESLNLASFLRQQGNPILRAYLAFEIRKLKAYETRECEKFDRVLMISDQDNNALLAMNSRIRTEVIPAGVDPEYFSPGEVAEESNSVLWMGSLKWPPNRDSFWWFYNDILPRIVEKMPGLRVHVVGSNPPRDIREIHHPNMKVLGFVEDVREYLQKAQVCVVPLRVGSGIRLKLLEMFAMGKAVVSTSLGCEGLNVTHREHLLIADAPETFAEAVIGLISDGAMRSALGDAARRHVRQRFDWEKVADAYEHTYRSVLRNYGQQA
jgi:glycosyltransferase involved in cell wall biosynthesis